MIPRAAKLVASSASRGLSCVGGREATDALAARWWPAAASKNRIHTPVPASDPPPIQYPETRADMSGDVSFGVRVADPFRWLEEDVRQSPEVRAWVDAQNAMTLRYLDALPGRAAFRERLTELWDFEKFGCPVRKGRHYFIEYNSGLQNQSVLRRQLGPDGQSAVILDPNCWSTDGSVALAQSAPSKGGERLAYALQEDGSDWRRVRIRDLAAGQDLAEELHWVKFSGLSWMPDGSGFYYSRFRPRTPARNSKGRIWARRSTSIVSATPRRPTDSSTRRPRAQGWVILQVSPTTVDGWSSRPTREPTTATRSSSRICVRTCHRGCYSRASRMPGVSPVRRARRSISSRTSRRHDTGWSQSGPRHRSCKR